MVKEFLDHFSRPLFSYRSHAKIAQLGKDGNACAMGKRKTSTANVTLQPGGGEVRVNGHGLLQYFPRVEDRLQVLFPLMVTGPLGQYSVEAMVRGGGTTGELSNGCWCTTQQVYNLELFPQGRQVQSGWVSAVLCWRFLGTMATSLRGQDF